MEKAITEFFQARKEAWLKKNLKASMDEEAIKATEKECEEAFAPENWLPNAAKRAGQISIATHPCTFSHPSARKNKNGYVSSIIANSAQADDGYLRSGNVAVEADALGNAAALDVYKFLMLIMADGKTLLSHIQADSELAVELLNIQSEPYDVLKTGFLAMVESQSYNITSAKIKQVYFPVDDGYHQLSLLTASGMVFELRRRIDTLRFSDETKAARTSKRDEQWHESGYKQLNNITTIGYGGTKPQNISVFNNQNGGKAHLLLSIHPALKKRDIQFPRVDFFSQSITPFYCKNIFYALHALFIKYKNNWEIREERFDYHQEVIDRIIEAMFAVRSVSCEQYNPDTSQLSQTQKIWLCEDYKELREAGDDWLDDIIKDVAVFIFHGYEKVIGKEAVKFGDGELRHITQQVTKAKEGLR